MINRLTLFVIIIQLVIPNRLEAQIVPKEGRALNYRIIGFSFPASITSRGYKLEIASGSNNDKRSFDRHIIKTMSIDTNRVVAEVPFFGQEYTWRVIYKENPESVQSTELHHFSTAIIQSVDTSISQLKVFRKATKFKDAFVFLDGNRALYDMSGNAVWFLPKIDSLDTNPDVLRDIKLSPRGTITFLLNENAYEVNYDGSILWKAPGNRSTNPTEDSFASHYHHQMNRLNNGHYMILGSEYLSWITNKNDSIQFFVPGNNTHDEHRMEFGTIMEYDKSGRTVWAWKASSYYTKLSSYCNEILKGGSDHTTHSNAFCFDEKKRNVYISFKNTSQIFKIKYPEGIVANVYGTLTNPFTPDTTNRLFCLQHSCNVSHDGFLYMFNNNACHPLEKPEIIMLDESYTKDTIKKIWDFSYMVNSVNFHPTTNEKSLPPKTSRKTNYGNVIELPDGSFFISECIPYANIFIVSRSKQLLWEAVVLRCNKTEKIWVPFPQYRASIIPCRNDLELLIWNQIVK